MSQEHVKEYVNFHIRPAIKQGRFRIKRFEDGYIKYRKILKDGCFGIEITENTSKKLNEMKYLFVPKVACMSDNMLEDGNYFDMRPTFADIRNFKITEIT